MSSKLIANRYAKALFQIGVDSGAWEKFKEELLSLVALTTSSPDFAHLVNTPRVYPSQKAKVMDQILENSNATLMFRNFIKILTSAGRIKLLPYIALSYQELIDHQAGIVEAKVLSAQPLTAKQTEALSKVLEAKTGKKIRLTCQQQASLLGGLRIQIGSTIFDASLLNQLTQIKTQLLSHQLSS